MKSAFYLVLLILCAIPFVGHSQSKTITISGFVQDAKSGERLIGAKVYDALRMRGTSSNTFGFYSLTLNVADSILFTVSYTGYTPFTKTIYPDKDVEFLVELQEANIELDVVKVQASKMGRIEETTRMSHVDIPIQQIKTTPMLLGEPDLIKTIQLLPGVQSGTEGTTGLYVRGGGPDQNLILLDGVPVYNAMHLFGFVSVFNPDAIKSVQLTKGGFPARFGGRLSSVIEVDMKEGNMKEWKAEGGVSVIAARLTIEGPIVKDQTSFIVSGRRSYLDLLTRPFMPQELTAGYYFYDMNAKVNHIIGKKDRVYFSVYAGDDELYSEEQRSGEYFKSGLGWGNVTSSLRWNHQFSNKLFSNTTLTYSQFRFLIGMEQLNSRGADEQEFAKLSYYSGIRDMAGKIDFDYAPNPEHYIKFGAALSRQRFSPGALQLKLETADLDENIDFKRVNRIQQAWNNYLYVEDDWTITPQFKANVGLHVTHFGLETQHFFSMQPRLAMRYLLENGVALKSSFSTMQQYVHLITNSGMGLPTDLWVPTTDRVPPQNSWQAAFGGAKTVLGGDYEFSTEVFYKSMWQIIELKEGATFLNPDDRWEEKVETGGLGRSFGLELLLQKKVGQTSGWIGYTWSKTERRFENLNDGNWFNFKFDRRHDVSIVMKRELNKRWDLGLTWVFGTGIAATAPMALYRNVEAHRTRAAFLGYQDNVIHYGTRNGYRMPAYHRMDIGLNYKKQTATYSSTWNISLYNAYNRINPFYMDLSNDSDGNSRVKLVGLFPIIPSISYSFSR